MTDPAPTAHALDRVTRRVLAGARAAWGRISPVLARLRPRVAGRWRPILRPTLASALTVAVVVAVFRLLDDQFLHNGMSYDEPYFFWGGWCITKGLVPYRDFIEFKPPLVFLTHALALALYGFKAFQFRWFFLWFPLASLVALHVALLTRRIDRLSALALILAIVQLWVNPRFHDIALSDSESIGLTYYFLGLACLIAKGRAQHWLKALGGGFLFCAVQSKEPFLPCVAVTWLGCFLITERRSTLRQDALAYLKVTGLGAGVVLFALCVYMIPTGAMKHYLAMVGGYFRFYRDPMQSYCVVLGRFHPTTPFNDLLKQFQKARSDFLNLDILGYLVPLAVAFFVFVARRSWILLATGFVGFVFALYAVAATNCQWIHYYNMSMSGLFFALILGIDSMQPYLKEPVIRRFVGVTLLASVLVPLAPRIEAEAHRFGTRQFADAYREPVPGVLAAIAQHTQPSDRIFTTGIPSLYVQADRISAVRESTIIDEGLGFYSGRTDEEKLSGVRAELERNQPKIMVLDPENARRKVRHYRALLEPFLTAHHYTKLSEYIWIRPD
jgi:hypothetical protein